MDRKNKIRPLILPPLAEVCDERASPWREGATHLCSRGLEDPRILGCCHDVIVQMHHQRHEDSWTLTADEPGVSRVGPRPEEVQDELQLQEDSRNRGPAL